MSLIPKNVFTEYQNTDFGTQYIYTHTRPPSFTSAVLLCSTVMSICNINLWEKKSVLFRDFPLIKSDYFLVLFPHRDRLPLSGIYIHSRKVAESR